MSLLIVGTVAFDGIETPFGKVDKVLGGSATYIGISASYFNSNSNLISVVGRDFLEKDIFDNVANLRFASRASPFGRVLSGSGRPATVPPCRAHLPRPPPDPRERSRTRTRRRRLRPGASGGACIAFA